MEIERDSMEIAKAEVLGETQEYEQSRKEKLAANSTPTLGQCFDDFLVYKNGVKEGTIIKYKFVKRTFELYGGKPLLKTPVAKITPQVMAEFLIKLGGKPQYFNTVSIVINQVFEMLRIKRIIKENPFHLLPRNITHRKVQITRDAVPTVEQCQKIAACIRSQSAASRSEIKDHGRALMGARGYVYLVGASVRVVVSLAVDVTEHFSC